ncbi:glycosyltransferase [Flavobacterium salmonis]|uniref:N-acetylgalactosamine-N, N'-diacetylbacillosaminyl-diphospho-undecaprenol 4-alpha-N-acetylgalactosaminyltransferase n=1 Tax=Flavobacterium salmonis TaxID=2654844 RepID=A0A6V6Z2I2_9FLAO|nr:glycosyltransferase [Flavobacterium salmonis]CAD0005961.1 N-acetylgalactosamine-N, N'-diacetylbacillosaminyl-diphospho-undecaprenol 4-alpha-N-acetylgalactosaminyltransferase [Flavobacterium salmonis]
MNKLTKQRRICIVSDQLAGGGAERCSALLSVFFERNNINVYHIIVVDKVEYEFSGKLINLGKLKNKRNDFFNKIKRFYILKKFLKENKFDFIIDTRVKNHNFQEVFISKYIYSSPLIQIIHSYMVNLYFPNIKFLAKYIYKHCYKIVTVSEKIKNKVEFDYKYQNVKTIYNPVDFDYINRKLIDGKIFSSDQYILAVGNMGNMVKQFDKLIYCYSKSDLVNKNIKLIILGEGVFRCELEKYVREIKLEHLIIFKGKIDNPFPYYKNAYFTVLSSKNEGFPNVLLESLACSTPVIAFDCLSGPKEIILNNENGLLVENQNLEKLTEAINLFVENEKLYNYCKKNAFDSIQQFSLDNIGKQWLDLMKIDLNLKK